MAITFRGFDTAGLQFDEAFWSKYQRALGALAAPHGVTAGLTAAAGAGTREVTFTAGEGIGPGVWFDSSASESVTLTANASGANRFDYVVARINWTANTVTLVAIPGTPALPALTQTAGTTWDVPLAIVTVRPSVGVFAAADIEVAKPLPRIARALVLDIPEALFYDAGTVPGVSGSFTNPGWPYRIQITGFCRVRAFGGVNPLSGFVIVQANINSGLVARAITANLSGGAQPVSLTGLSGVLTGPALVSMVMTPNSFPSAQGFELIGTVDQLAVLQIPA